jgi:hypothetical protein
MDDNVILELGVKTFLVLAIAGVIFAFVKLV